MLKTSLLLSLLLLSSSPLSAQANAPACTDRKSIIHGLSSEYGEDPIAMGLSSNGGVVELLVRSDGQTWTILITYPNGSTCVVAVGKFWENLSVLKGQAS